MAKKKYKVKFSEQVRDTFDKLLDRKDKKTFEKFAKTVQDIAEDPSIGKLIIPNSNEEILERFSLYEGREVKLCVLDWGESIVYDMFCPKTSGPGEKLEENLDDLHLKIGEDRVDLFGASIWRKNVRIYLKDLREKLEGNLCFSSAGYLAPYYIVNLCSNGEVRKFSIKSYGVTFFP